MNPTVAMAIPVLLVALAACASCANVDVHFGADQIDDGLGYWKYGVGSRPIYSFYWHGDTVSVRDGYGNATTYIIAASACVGLNEAKSKLMHDIEESVTALLDAPPMLPPKEELADAPLHRLVYHPQGQADRLELSGFEETTLRSWIESVQVVRSIIRDCRDN